MPDISVIIPARTEKFLNLTIKSVLSTAVGDIEIIAVLDGYDDTPYEKIIDKRVKYISLPAPDNHERHKRQGVNAAISISHAKYVMWLDAHCILAEGFDEILTKDCEDDWVVIPRRRRVDVEKWEGVDYVDTPPIDYEYWMWGNLKKGRLRNYKWNSKSIKMKDVPIDDIFCGQGSLFFMTRKHFDRMGFMKIEGYTGWGQEGEEICMTTLLNGGRAIVNKKTWYAHLRKGQVHGRMYKETDVTPSYDYSYDYWVHEKREFFVETINKFMPIPNFPPDWERRIYGQS